MRTPKRPTPGQITSTLGIAVVVVTVVMLVHFGGTDPSYRIQAGMVWGGMAGVFWTRLWLSRRVDKRHGPHRAPYY